MATVAEDDPAQAQAEDLRDALHDAYVLVESAKAAQTFSSLTMEDHLALFIEKIEGQGTRARPNALERVERVVQNALVAIEKVKAIPPEAFRAPDPDKDVNTPV